MALSPGFAEPVLAAQSCFRAIMEASARPGQVYRLSGERGEAVAPPAPLSRGAGALALTLFDQDTPVWLDAPLCAENVTYWLRFHTRAPIVGDPQHAAFAILADPERAPPFDAFALGTLDYPDRSATLILQVDSLGEGRRLVLTGPGIKGRTTLHATPLPADLLQRLATNSGLFPRGIDLLLVTESSVAALPRSVTASEEA
jgi:alpha-D-ribose 1-methylphosphonate 5-triphosphate synthase subunit PhnH